MSAALQTTAFHADTSLDRLTRPDPSSLDLRFRALFWRKYASGNAAGLTTEQYGRILSNCCTMEDVADRLDHPSPIVALVPRIPAKRKPVQPAVATITAERFWSLHKQAVTAIWNAYGERWHSRAPLSETVCLTVPARLCAMTGPLGGKIKWRRDWRMPAAKYWPGGVLPDCGLLIAPPVRHQGPLPGAGMAAIVQYQIVADRQAAQRRAASIPQFPRMTRE